MKDRLFTKKQAKAFLEANHRWNLFCGATRSGKTYLTFHLIPKRIKELPEGNCCMIGKTLSTLAYNVLNPMRDKFGEENVSAVKRTGDGLTYVVIFGREFRILGADNKRAVAKLQGSSLVYAYGDEISTWDKGVFDMLKSRLDSAKAKFDGTTNPAEPQCWLKQFIDSADKKGIDLYIVNFIIDDNDFLDPEFIEALKAEYRGTVYYDRFILGRWVAAEGSIYTPFVSDKKKHIIDKLPNNAQGFITIGIDFGGNKSGHAFNASLVDLQNGMLYTIKDLWNNEKVDPQELEQMFVNFMNEINEEYSKFPIAEIRADSAEQVLIRGLQASLIKNKLNYEILNAKKGVITERIKAYIRLFGSCRYKILESCKETINAFESAVWSDAKGKESRLDDGSSNIDSLDSQEYSTENYMEELLLLIEYGGR